MIPSNPQSDSDISRFWTQLFPTAFVVGVLAIWVVDFDFYQSWIIPEIGLVELGQALTLIIALIVALYGLSLARQMGDRLLTFWLGMAALCCFYVAGEELSWGQQLAGWATPEGWQAINDQQETNLHNVSSWFDQKPRLILELGILFGGLVLPILIRRKPELANHPFAMLFPPTSFAPLALLTLALRIPEAIKYRLPGRGEFFERPSEIQESLFFFFVLFYLIVLIRRMRLAQKEA